MKSEIPEDFVFTRDEDNNLEQALSYIANTYGEHYRSQQSEIQLIDVWQSRGTLLTTAIDTAIKYLWRFGRKGGYNKKDIFKSIHYSLLALYAADQAEANEKQLIELDRPVG